MRTVLDNLDELTVRRQLARAAADHSMLESLLELIERNKACADLKQDDDGDRDEN